MIAEFPILSDDETTRSTARRTRTRGQSEVITVVLLLFIVIISVAAIVASGSSVLGAARDTAEITAAEHAFEDLDADASAVALGTAPSRTTGLGLDANDGEVRYRDAGWIRVDVYSEANGTANVVNQSFGTIEYGQGETTVAAQGGGVWRSDGDGSTMLSRPEFHYRKKTLTLPIVSIDGERDLAKQIQITREREPEQKYPNRSVGLLNPPDSGTVTVTVQSDYYDAWGRYFEEETDAIVSYDHARERVTILFVVLPDRSTFGAGIIATSSTGELAVAGTGAYVNSYDSSVGNYSETKAANGEIQTAGDFLASGNSLVDGTVNSNGTANLQGSTTINGSLYWGEAPEPDSTEKSKVVGSVNRTDGVRTVMPINSFVKNYSEQVEQRNDNDQTTAVSNNQLSLSGSSATLEAGSYYLHDVTLDGEKLTLDTTDGDVTVIVRDYVKLTQGGNITVVGDGTATFVVAGENDTVVSPTGLGSKQINFHVGKGSDVHVPGEVSSQFRLYGTEEFNATIAGSNSNKANFDGIIYAPAGTTGSGYVYVKQGNLYGLAVTGNLTIGQYGAAHYDYGLSGSTEIRSPFSEIEQLHVTVHHARVAGGT